MQLKDAIRPAGLGSVHDLYAALAASDSATEVLERFTGAPVTAERVREKAERPGPERRCLLQMEADQVVRHRRSLLCARGEVLVVADLWYVPARLPPERMRDLTTTTPFGRVMRGLKLKRRILASRYGGPRAQTALHVHALVLMADGTPVAEVVERYRRSAAGSRSAGQHQA